MRRGHVEVIWRNRGHVGECEDMWWGCVVGKEQTTKEKITKNNKTNKQKGLLFSIFLFD